MTNKTTSRVAVGAISTLAAAFLGYSLFSDSEPRPKNANQPNQLFSAPQAYANVPLEEPETPIQTPEPQTSALEQVIEQTTHTAPQPTPELTVEEKLREYLLNVPLQDEMKKYGLDWSDAHALTTWQYLTNQPIDDLWKNPWSEHILELYKKLDENRELQAYVREAIFSRLDDDKMRRVADWLFEQEEPAYLGESPEREQRLDQLATLYKQRILECDPLHKDHKTKCLCFNNLELKRLVFSDTAVLDYCKGNMAAIEKLELFFQRSYQSFDVLLKGMSLETLEQENPVLATDMLSFPRNIELEVYTTEYGKSRNEFYAWKESFEGRDRSMNLPVVPKKIEEDMTSMRRNLINWRQHLEAILNFYDK